jgi:hypothetical protein
MLWAPMYFMGSKFVGFQLREESTSTKTISSYLPKNQIRIQIKLSGENNWPKGNFSRSYNRIMFKKLKKLNAIL